MRTIDEINRIIQKIPKEWRNRWCSAGECGCMGCVNGSGHAYLTKDEYLTKEEHDLWKESSNG